MIDNTGYVVGVMLGDGSFAKQNGKDYHVQMSTKDREFAVRFAEALSEIVRDKVPVNAYKRHPNEWGNGVKHVVKKGMRSRIPGLKLLMKHGAIRTASQEFKLGVVSGLFDSEGCLSADRGRIPVVRFGVCDKELAKLWQGLCKELFGLDAPVTGPSKAGEYYITYCGMVKCSKFFAEVPITIDRKQKRWQQFLDGEIVLPWT